MAVTSGQPSPMPVVFWTLVCALILNMVRYPEWMVYARPDWVLLVLFYWSLAIPQRVGVGTGWLTGLAMDILNYSILGQHAIAKSMVALAGVSAHRRLRLYELWQQCVVVFVIACIDIGITTWIYHLAHDTPVKLVYWQSALTSCLLWPVIYNMLRLLRHRKGIR